MAQDRALIDELKKDTLEKAVGAGVVAASTTAATGEPTALASFFLGVALAEGSGHVATTVGERNGLSPKETAHLTASLAAFGAPCSVMAFFASQNPRQAAAAAGAACGYTDVFRTAYNTRNEIASRQGTDRTR